MMKKKYIDHPKTAIPWILSNDFYVIVGLSQNRTKIWFSVSQALTMLLLISLTFIELLFFEKYVNIYVLTVINIVISFFMRNLIFWGLWLIF